jgi:hypothetical protein
MSLFKGFSGGLSAGAKVRAAKDAKAGATAKAAGTAPPVTEASPMERAGNWVKDKLSSLTGDAASSASAPAAQIDPNGSQDVGLVERLKAGNIDDPESEAYRRWGKGKGALVAPTGSASAVVDPDAGNPDGTYTNDQWANTPSYGADDNPAWQEFENTPGGF